MQRVRAAAFAVLFLSLPAALVGCSGAAEDGVLTAEMPLHRVGS